MSFSLATYNVLAQAYITPSRYPRTPASVLASAWRRPALVRHIGALATDVVCLQEVEDKTFAAVQQALGPLGYTGPLCQERSREARRVCDLYPPQYSGMGYGLYADV